MDTSITQLGPLETPARAKPYYTVSNLSPQTGLVFHCFWWKAHAAALHTRRHDVFKMAIYSFICVYQEMLKRYWLKCGAGCLTFDLGSLGHNIQHIRLLCLLILLLKMAVKWKSKHTIPACENVFLLNFVAVSVRLETCNMELEHILASCVALINEGSGSQQVQLAGGSHITPLIVVVEIILLPTHN